MSEPIPRGVNVRPVRDSKVCVIPLRAGFMCPEGLPNDETIQHVSNALINSGSAEGRAQLRPTFASISYSAPPVRGYDTMRRGFQFGEACALAATLWLGACSQAEPAPESL